MKEIIMLLILGSLCLPACGFAGPLLPIGDVPILKENPQTSSQGRTRQEALFRPEVVRRRDHELFDLP